MWSGARVFLKYASIIFIFHDVEPGTFPSLSFTRMGTSCVGLLMSHGVVVSCIVIFDAFNVISA